MIFPVNSSTERTSTKWPGLALFDQRKDVLFASTQRFVRSGGVVGGRSHLRRWLRMRNGLCWLQHIAPPCYSKFDHFPAILTATVGTCIMFRNISIQRWQGNCELARRSFAGTLTLAVNQKSR